QIILLNSRFPDVPARLVGFPWWRAGKCTVFPESFTANSNNWIERSLTAGNGPACSTMLPTTAEEVLRAQNRGCRRRGAHPWAALVGRCRRAGPGGIGDGPLAEPGCDERTRRREGQ